MPGGLALQVRLSTDTTIQQRASVDQSFDFDLSNTGTIRLLRESCGEVNINAEGIQIKGRGRSAGRGRSGSPSDAHYKVSARDICEFQVRVRGHVYSRLRPQNYSSAPLRNAVRSRALHPISANATDGMTSNWANAPRRTAFLCWVWFRGGEAVVRPLCCGVHRVAQLI
jgi:hypothetical protein